jgi:tRNA threonylcarbamoyladenosine biosynthesis protein TsaB
MRILAIDAALPAVSACVMDQGVAEPLASETVEMARGHAEALIPLVRRVMEAVDGGFDSLDRIAVTVGPGSFTGIRVGVAAARGFGLARGIPVVGVSTLAAFSAPFILDGDERPIVACIDARHGQSYLQMSSARGKTILAPFVAKTKEAAAMVGSDPCRVTGSGAGMMAVAAWMLGVKAEVVGELVAPRIEFVARLGLAADPRTAPPRPLYLKAPDARSVAEIASAAAGAPGP